MEAMRKGVPLRIGVVGAGFAAGVHHLPILCRLKDARVVALCDEKGQKAQGLAQRFSIPRTFTSVEEMLRGEGMDLIDICIPPQYHKPVILQALEAGLPCLVEKPFTVTTAEADEVIQRARNKAIPLFPIFGHPYMDGVRRAKELLARGILGQIVGVHISYSEPFPSRYLDPNHWCHSLPGDYFSDAEPHLAMVLVELLGPVQEVKALASKLSSHPALPMDELRILARFESGALGSIAHSVNCPSSFMSIDIVGTRGLLRIDGFFNVVVRYGPRARVGNPWALGLAFARGILSQGVGLAGSALTLLVHRYLLRSEPDAHRYLLPQALSCLQGKGGYPVDLDKTRESVRLLELAFNSLQEKQWPPGYDRLAKTAR